MPTYHHSKLSLKGSFEKCRPRFREISNYIENNLNGILVREHKDKNVVYLVDTSVLNIEFYLSGARETLYWSFGKYSVDVDIISKDKEKG